MTPQDSNEVRDGMLPAAHGSPSSDLGYDAELTTAQLHAQWVAKYEQTHDLWNRDNCRNNARIEALETAARKLVAAWDEDEIGQVDGELIDALRYILPENSDYVEGISS